MHAITSHCIAAIDAGRQALSTSRSQNPYTPEFDIFMPKPESSAKKAARKLSQIRRKMKVVRRSTLKKVTQLVESANPITRRSRAAAEKRLAELTRAYEDACLVAFANESERNRLIQKESMMRHWSSEEFDRVIPPSLTFVSNEWAKETAERIWNELVAASERK